MNASLRMRVMISPEPQRLIPRVVREIERVKFTFGCGSRNGVFLMLFLIEKILARKMPFTSISS